MCGIFACIPSNHAWLESAVENMHQRGPDEMGILEINDVGIAVTRLSIADVNNGSQPLVSSTGDVVGVFNGAIYNTDELIRDYQLSPINNNDGAIALELYERIGLAFSSLLEGMFAFILYDKRINRVVAVRDPIGIKPLFWTPNSNELVFSSSLSSIPKSLLNEVRSFTPGLSWSSTGEKVYSTIPMSSRLQLTESLQQSVSSQIPLEVNWGCMLSGGLDSSLICALAKEITGKSFPVYTLYAGESTDIHSARVLSESLELDLNEVLVDEQDILRGIHAVVLALGTYEVDLVINGLGAYFIAEAASRDGIKVLLTGEGADELFAGYSQYYGLPAEQLNDTLIEHQHDLCVTECKRLDAVTMAAGIEARVPYLSNKVIASARVTNANEKIVVCKHEIIDKLCLREVAQQYLQNSIAMRPKEPFLVGSGLDILINNIAKRIRHNDVDEIERNRFELESATEVWVYSIWKKYYFSMSSGKRDMKRRGLARRIGRSLSPEAVIF